MEQNNFRWVSEKPDSRVPKGHTIILCWGGQNCITTFSGLISRIENSGPKLQPNNLIVEDHSLKCPQSKYHKIMQLFVFPDGVIPNGKDMNPRLMILYISSTPRVHSS